MAHEDGFIVGEPFYFDIYAQIYKCDVYSEKKDSTYEFQINNDCRPTLQLVWPPSCKDTTPQSRL